MLDLRFPQRRLERVLSSGMTHNQIDHILTDRIQMCLMSSLSGEQPVIHITLGWLQKLGRDWQKINDQCKNLLQSDSVSRKHEVEGKEHCKGRVSNRL
jgi:hypothetical protein